MLTTLALATSLLLGQTGADDAPLSTAPVTEVGKVSAPHVGKGHYNFGTSGSLFANTGGTSVLGFDVNGSVGYFIADPLLIAAGISLSGSTTTGTGAAGRLGFFLSAAAEYWLPFAPTVFGYLGASAGVGPGFSFSGAGGSSTSVSWFAGPYVGASIFLTNWLAIEPRLQLTFDPGIDIRATWGLSWYL